MAKNHRFRNLLLTLTALLGALGLALFLNTLRGTSHMEWSESMPGNIGRIALRVEMFRMNEDRYPASLTELLTNKYTDNKPYLAEMLQGGSKQYLYQVETNGFVITISRPGSLTRPAERTTRRFSYGEALR